MAFGFAWALPLSPHSCLGFQFSSVVRSASSSPPLRIVVFPPENLFHSTTYPRSTEPQTRRVRSSALKATWRGENHYSFPNHKCVAGVSAAGVSPPRKGFDSVTPRVEEPSISIRDRVQYILDKGPFYLHSHISVARFAFRLLRSSSI